MIRSSCIVLLLLFTACTRYTEKSGYSFQSYEQNGVTIIETTNGPRYSEPLFTCEESFRLIDDESVSGSMLARPRWIGMDEEGMVYVFDGISPRQDVRLAVFDQQGVFSHVIGRMGHGPGEYLAPKLLSIEGGIVTLFEGSSRRISYFSTDGSFIRLSTLAPGEAIPDRAYLDDDENQIIIYAHWDAEGNYQQAVIQNREGDLVGTVETPKVPRFSGVETSSANVTTPPHYNGLACIEYVPDRGIMCTTGNDAVVEWYDLSGRLQTVYKLGLDPGPVTDEDHALADSYFKDLWLDGNQLGEELYRAWLRKDKYPETRAFWNAVQIDEYGYLWLEDPSSHFHPTDRLFRVVDPGGEYLGNCVLPQGQGRVSKGHYLLIEINYKTGEQNLIVYRLKPAVKGLEYP